VKEARRARQELGAAAAAAEATATKRGDREAGRLSTLPPRAFS